MLQFLILGYLVYEIIRLSQLTDVNAIKFAPPTTDGKAPSSTKDSMMSQPSTPSSSLSSSASASDPPSTSTAISEVKQ